jgi:hypothetical protein
MITPNQWLTVSTFAGSMEMLKKMTNNDTHLVFRSDVGIAKEIVIWRKILQQ